MIWIDKNNKISELKKWIKINQKELDEIIKVKEEKKQKLIDMIDLYLKSINLKKIKEEDYILFKRLTWLDWKTEKDKFIYVILIEKNELIDIHIKEIRISNNIEKYKESIVEYESTRFDRWSAIWWTILWTINVWGVYVLILWAFSYNISDWIFLMTSLFILIVIISISIMSSYNNTKNKLESSISNISKHKKELLESTILEYERIKEIKWDKIDMVDDIQNIKNIVKDPKEYYENYNKRYYENRGRRDYDD